LSLQLEASAHAKKLSTNSAALQKSATNSLGPEVDREIDTILPLADVEDERDGDEDDHNKELEMDSDLRDKLGGRESSIESRARGRGSCDEKCSISGRWPIREKE